MTRRHAVSWKSETAFQSCLPAGPNRADSDSRHNCGSTSRAARSHVSGKVDLDPGRSRDVDDFEDLAGFLQQIAYRLFVR